MAPLTATRVRARPEASSRHRRRPLEPHRSRGRGSRSPRDLASLGDQPGLASSLASSSCPSSTASSCWSTVLLGCPESRPRSSCSFQFAAPCTCHQNVEPFARPLQFRSALDTTGVRTSRRSSGRSRFCQWLHAEQYSLHARTSSVHIAVPRVSQDRVGRIGSSHGFFSFGLRLFHKGGSVRAGLDDSGMPQNFIESVSVQFPGSGERGERIAAVVGGDQFAEVGEQRAALHSAGGRGGEGAFGEPLAVCALGAEREFSVDDRCRGARVRRGCWSARRRRWW